MAYQAIIGSKIVSTPDLLKWHPRATFIPNPMVFMNYRWDEGPIRIAHAPTNRELKGTELILQAIRELQAEGLPFEFDLIENLPRNEFVKRIQKAHIVIDQVNGSKSQIPGLIGVISLETLSMGHVSVCHVADEMLPYYPDLPVVNVEPTVEGLKGSLIDLINDPEEARKRGLLGPGYIRKHHSLELIAQRHLAIYKTLLDEGMG